MDFCVSCRETTKFKQEVAANKNMDDVIENMTSSETFTQWAANDVDHSLWTPDRTGIFHAMSIIAMSSSTTKCLRQTKEFDWSFHFSMFYNVSKNVFWSVNTHDLGDHSEDVISQRLLSRSISGVSFNFITCVELEVPGGCITRIRCIDYNEKRLHETWKELLLDQILHFYVNRIQYIWQKHKN